MPIYVAKQESLWRTEAHQLKEETDDKWSIATSDRQTIVAKSKQRRRRNHQARPHAQQGIAGGPEVARLRNFRPFSMGDFNLKNGQEKLKTSPTLVALPNCKGLPTKQHIGLFDSLSKNFAYCPIETVYWLQYFDDWRSFDDACAAHAHYPRNVLQDEVLSLVDAGFILCQGTPAANRSEEYERNWQWGIIPGLFHFTALDTEFLTEGEVHEKLVELAGSPGGPLLTWESRSTSINLPEPMGWSNSLPHRQHSLVRTMSRRRTNRTSAGHELSNVEISTCLFSGMGITSYVETPTGQLPLSMTPSGGARNPFEAFLVIKRSQDLLPGIYRYMAQSHQLEVVSQGFTAPLSLYFADQKWIDSAAGVIVLVAVMERTTWKYTDANSYKVIPIEAGHIAQNIMLAATELGLTCCPTAAISHSRVSECLALKSLTHMPIYALSLDKCLPYPDNSTANSRLPWLLSSADVSIAKQ